MLMTTASATVPFSIPTHKTGANTPADDVQRRILEVRAGWDVQERIRRRRAARERFNSLVEALLVNADN